MLNFFRKSRRSIMGMILVALMVLTMFSFGVSSGFSRASQTTAATINDQQITFDEYYKTRDNLINYYRQRFQGNFEQFSKFLKIDQQTIDSMVNDILVQDFYNQVGLAASIADIQGKIRSQEYFQESGFTQASYAYFLRATGLTEDKLKAAFAKDIIQEQLTTSFADLLQPTTAELKTIYNQDNRQAQFRYLEINPAEFESKITTISEDQLNDYFSKNNDAYRQPKSVRYSYVQFQPKDFEEKAEINAEDLTLAYEEQKSNFIDPAQLHLRQIFFEKIKDKKTDGLKELLDKDNSSDKNSSQSDFDPNTLVKQKAEKALKRIKDGEDFSKVAQELSQDSKTASTGGDLGWFVEKNIPENLKEAVKKLPLKQTSDIIDTEDGYYLVYIEESKPQRLKTLEEVKDTLEKQLRQTQAPVYARALAYNLQNLWSKDSSKSLIEFAKTQNIEAVEIKAPLKDQENPPGINNNLTAKIIDYPQGSHELIEIENNIYLVDLLEVKESYIPDLSVVKDEVIHAFKKQEGRKQAKEFTEKLLVEINSSKNFDETAKKYQLVSKETPLTLQKDLVSPPFTAEDIKRKIFALTISAPISQEVFENGDSFYLVELLQSKLPDGNDFDSKKSDLLTSEKQKIRSRMTDTFLAILKAKAKIDINPTLYSSINN